MKQITDIIKNLGQNEIDYLKDILQIKNFTASNHDRIAHELLSYHGLHHIFSSLSGGELAVAGAIQHTDGLTFGELEKILNIGTDAIEQIARSLAKKALVTILKNRQRIHNKLDKVAFVKEISAFINRKNNSSLAAYLDGFYRTIVQTQQSDVTPPRISISADARSFIRMIYEKGAIIEFPEAAAFYPSPALDDIIIECHRNGLIETFFDFHNPFSFFLLLTVASLDLQSRQETRHQRRIDNHYNFLVNLLKIHDGITTSGLFFTKKNLYRKVDKKRVIESMINLYDLGGNRIDEDRLFDISIHVLRILKCLTIEKNNITSSLKSIHNLLESPSQLILQIIRMIDGEDGLPDHADIKVLMEILTENRTIKENFLKTLFFIYVLGKSGHAVNGTVSQLREKGDIRFYSAINFLCLIGLVRIDDGGLLLSETGVRAAIKVLNSKAVVRDAEKSAEPCILINPDFTLIIPDRDMPAEALYHILSHTEVVRIDTVIHARITRTTIVYAHKRGMSYEKLLTALKKYSKNEIPQNLQFLIPAWIEQIRYLRISRPTVLYSDDASFIDEICHHEIKSCVIRRIAPQYAIVNKNDIDTIVAFAKKKDVLVGLFEDDTEDTDIND